MMKMLVPCVLSLVLLSGCGSSSPVPAGSGAGGSASTDCLKLKKFSEELFRAKQARYELVDSVLIDDGSPVSARFIPALQGTEPFAGPYVSSNFGYEAQHHQDISNGSQVGCATIEMSYDDNVGHVLKLVEATPTRLVSETWTGKRDEDTGFTPKLQMEFNLVAPGRLVVRAVAPRRAELWSNRCAPSVEHHNGVSTTIVEYGAELGVAPTPSPSIQKNYEQAVAYWTPERIAEFKKNQEGYPNCR